MILLLSTAANIYWLGRYMIRIDGLCRLLPFADDAEAAQFAKAMSLSAHDAASLNQLLNDPTESASIQANLHAVRDNMQAVRGVISQSLFEVMNDLTSPNIVGTRDVCELVAETQAAVGVEATEIRLFWQLGQCIEQIDSALRFKHAVAPAIDALHTVIDMLSSIGWHHLEQPWLTLQSQQDKAALYALCHQVHVLFEDGP